MMKIETCFLIVITVFIVECSKTNTEGNNSRTDENLSIELSAKDVVLYNGVETEFYSSANGNITQVSYFFDGLGIGTMIQGPFKIKFTPEDIDPGIHKLKCIVRSEIGNEFSAEITLEIKLRLGDKFKGGKIFYLTEGGDHGLIAAVEDLGPNSDMGFFWGQYGLLGTNNDNGSDNTIKMISVASNEDFAGYFFKSGYNYNGFNDWYIPSMNELKILKSNKDIVGGFNNTTDWRSNYWSSSEIDETMAQSLHFNVLMGGNLDKGSYKLKVRAIRKF